jgi:hypothetical protein
LILLAGHNRYGLDAIMDRANSFVPEPFRLLHNLVFFVVGVHLHRSRHELHSLSRYGLIYLALSIPVFACRAVLINHDLAHPLHGLGAIGLVLSGALMSWLIAFGLLGLALRLFDRPHRPIAYLADSSYWVYLIHLPIVGLLQVNMYAIAAPAVVKFTLVLTVTLTLCLASYQVAVRYTFLGYCLHGKRARNRSAVQKPDGPQAIGERRPNAVTGPRMIGRRALSTARPTVAQNSCSIPGHSATATES